MGAMQSGSNLVLLLVKIGIQAHRVRISHQMLPAVMAKLTHMSRSLLVTSVHLAPYPEGKPSRQLQIAGCCQLLRKKAKPW